MIESPMTQNRRGKIHGNYKENVPSCRKYIFFSKTLLNVVKTKVKTSVCHNKGPLAPGGHTARLPCTFVASQKA